MPYNPTWNNQYLAQNPYHQMAPVMPQQSVQPFQQTYQQPTGRTLVDGPTEAMNRFLMRYPANQLVPGFISDELFDVNGRQFHVLSVEADGRRNLETFDYSPHVESTRIMVDGVEFESREEFDTLAAKVRAVLGAQNGVHATVPASGSAANGTQGTNVNASADDAGRPIATHTSGSGVGGYMRDA